MAKTPQEIIALNEAKRREAEVNLELASSLEEEAKARAELDDILIDSLKHQIAHADALGISADKAKELTESVSALIAVRKEEAATAEATTKAQQEYNAAVLKAKGQTEALIDSLTGLSSNWRTQTSSMALTTAGAEGVAQAFKDVGNVTDILGSMFATTFESSLELTKGFDDMTVSLNMATGQGTRFEEELISIEQSMRMHGVTTAELSAATEGLLSNFNSFTNESAATRKDLIEGTAILDKFGISAVATAKNLGIMTTAMGMSATAAIDTQMAMFAFASKEGLNTSKFFADFEAHQGTLARFGDQGADVFKELALAAQKSNMEVSQLLSIIDQFDRFDSAAESVGRMNALLGGPFLNSLEMVTSTDPIDRLQMLQDSLVSAGKDFESMSYYERQAIADAMGLADVGELALLMGGQFEHLAGGAQLTQQEYEDLAKRSAEFNTIQQELTQTMQMFAISMKPALDMLKGFMNFIQGLPDGTRKFIGLLILGIGALVQIFKITKALMVAKAAYTTIQTAATAATVASTAAKVGEPAAEAAATPVRAAATPVMIAYGAAALKMGAGAFLAGAGLALMFGAISLADAPSILAAATAIGVLTGAVLLLAAPLTALGAFISTGAGAVVFGIIVAGFAAIALSASVLAAAMSLVVNAVAAVFSAMGSVVTAISGVITAMGQLSGEQFMAAAMGIAAMGAAISALPVVKTVMLKTVFDSAEAFQATANISAAAQGQITATTAPGAAAKAPNVNVIIKQNADMRKLTAFIKQTHEEQLA